MEPVGWTPDKTRFILSSFFSSPPEDDPSDDDDDCDAEITLENCRGRKEEEEEERNKPIDDDG